jgi:hypothetical protein
MMKTNEITKTTTKKWNRWKIDDLTRKHLIQYYENVNKFPNIQEITMLANKFNVTNRNIRVFFQNRRQRSIDIKSPILKTEIMLGNKINFGNNIDFTEVSLISNEQIDDYLNEINEENIILEHFKKEDSEIIFKSMNLEYNKLYKIYILSVALKKLFNKDYDYITNLNLAYYYIENMSDDISDIFVEDLLQNMIYVDKFKYTKDSYSTLKKRILRVLENI